MKFVAAALLGACVAVFAYEATFDNQAIFHPPQKVPDIDLDSPTPIERARAEARKYVSVGNMYNPNFAGIGTFAHLPYGDCWAETATHDYDIAVMGVPFDMGVSFRPGARFGPSGIREGSKRIKGYNPELKVNPFLTWAKLTDCGDVPVTPFDTFLAIETIEAYTTHNLERGNNASDPIHDQKPNPPRIITLGGDHTVLLPILRALRKTYGRPISVIHFDSHLDTWAPELYGLREPNVFTHGNPLYHAAKEGLTTNGTSLHVGIRSNLYDQEDFVKDRQLGFNVVKANDIFALGVDGMIQKMRDFIKSEEDPLVYVSIDIDVLDPAFAPATGTPETGGLQTRELRAILRGLDGVKLVGADIVEVAPAYDTQAQPTSFAAADLIYELSSLMVRTKVFD